ncbi:MAG: hypothetical protein B1H03_06250 [Planctomycetales bacterium 4484_113]|nr:MAG: hypothetical protein B1H03_06250 [Planctomycetales bacterium 4484_113]
MRVGLDGQALVGGIPTGFGVYAELVHRALAELAESEEDFDFEIFRPVPEDQPLATTLQRLRWEERELPRRIRAAKRARGLDLFHSPCLGTPRSPFVPLIATVHDLILARTPGRGWLSRWYFSRVIPAGWKRARLLMTDTQTVKEQLAVEYSLPRERIVVTPLTSRFHGEQRQPTRPDPPWIFLLVGTHEPRKNFPLAITAFAALPRKLRENSRLLIVGQRTPHTEALISLARELGVSAQLGFAGYQSAHELAATYRAATALIFPSTEEGFGLPPLEAMSLGVPVLLSAIPVHQETYAQAEDLRNPGFFSPRSSEQIAELMRRVVEDDEFRSQLLSFGDAMSEKLNPARFRQKLIDAYRKVFSAQ